MLRRILITLTAYDTEVSYVQGMNEIVAPILLTLQVCFNIIVNELLDQLFKCWLIRKQLLFN